MIDDRGGRRTVSFAIALWTTALASALVVGGCAKGEVCQELSSCGGSPVGQWAQRPAAESGGKYCQEALHQPPLSEYLQGQPTPVARMRVPESTNLDWCYSLVLTREEMAPIKRALYYWENLVYLNGLLTYEDNGTYRLDFGRLGKMNAYYSRTCMRQYGNDFDCTKFQETLEDANRGGGEYFNFQCSENTAKGGCNCVFSISEADAQGGVYKAEGNTITHFPTSQNVHFSEAALCVRGDRMELSGRDNSYLWDRPGLRTIEMVRINCEDGVHGPGEMGVDCGARCPRACPM